MSKFLYRSLQHGGEEAEGDEDVVEQDHDDEQHPSPVNLPPGTLMKLFRSNHCFSPMVLLERS